MKKTIFFITIAAALIAAAQPVYAKTNPLEDAIIKTSRKIAKSPEIPQNAKFAFTDFRETATGRIMNLSLAIEDELSIALIREMPGRLTIKDNNASVSKEEEKKEVFSALEDLQEYAKKTDANYIIGGSYYFDSENAVIHVNVVNTADGIILFSERIKIKRSDLAKKLQPENN